MKSHLKTIILFKLFIFLSAYSLTAQSKYPIDDFSELTDNKPINYEAWEILPPGIHFTWASKDNLFFWGRLTTAMASAVLQGSVPGFLAAL